MITYLTSGLPVFAVVVLTIIIVFGGLVFYALRTKGDVFAELSHGKTAFRFDARDRRNTKRL
jgi:Ni,Fe-hydrogenase I cytochrome b subunit